MAPQRTLLVALRIRSSRTESLRSSWWLPLPLVKISTPSRPIGMCGLPPVGFGLVKSRRDVQENERQGERCKTASTGKTLPGGSEQLFAGFAANARIAGGYYTVAKWNSNLASNVADFFGHIVVFQSSARNKGVEDVSRRKAWASSSCGAAPLSMHLSPDLGPGRKPALLSVVAVAS